MVLPPLNGPVLPTSRSTECGHPADEGRTPSGLFDVPDEDAPETSDRISRRASCPYRSSGPTGLQAGSTPSSAATADFTSMPYCWSRPTRGSDNQSKSISAPTSACTLASMVRSERWTSGRSRRRTSERSTTCSRRYCGDASRTTTECSSYRGRVTNSCEPEFLLGKIRSGPIPIVRDLLALPSTGGTERLRRARRPVATCLCLRPTSWTELL
jgi:hypothetical protein